MSGGADVARAVELLRAGRLVAIPTETVYGLAADATSADAVARVFAAKGRPATNPLIVHVAGVGMAKRHAYRWPQAARLLGQAFWPGPLTLVLPKTRDIPDLVTAGQTTVGLRVPAHPLALHLLRLFDGPLAAPSANQSNYVSPTTAAHVRDELGDRVDMILDGGPCLVGIESTVVDLSNPDPRARPTLLRPGAVSREQIEAIIGPINVRDGTTTPDVPADSPGQHAVHYSPRTWAVRFPLGTMPSLATDATRVGLLLLSPPRIASAHVIIMPTEAAAYARQLYDALRSLDARQLDLILVETPPDTPPWAAVHDRLCRATKLLVT